MMKKKTLAAKLGALLLSGIMAVSMAGCGGDDGGSSKSSAGGDKQQGSSREESKGGDSAAGDSGEAPSGENEAGGAVKLHEPKDMEGRTIKIALWWDEFWDSNYKTLEDVTAAGGNYSDAETMQMKLDKIREIEERWNCRIEWTNLTWDGMAPSINTSITAGTPDCDIYMVNLQFGIPAVLNGYAQKISSYAPEDSDILNDKVVLSPYGVMGNEDYLMCVSGDLLLPNGATYMVYNASMLDSLNLEAPEKLAERGEWTWEKFAEYALTCTRDTDGDGNKDVYGFGALWTDVVSLFCASNNATIANSAKEGLSDPKTVEAFNFMERLYNTDGTARFSDDWDNNWKVFYQGITAFTIQRPHQMHDNAATVDFDVRICPAPTGPSGDGSMTPALDINSYFIPRGVKDPTSVYLIFEEMQNWFNGDTFYRDDPEWFEACFVDEEQLALGYREGAKANDDLWGNIDSGSAVGDTFYGVCVNKDMTVSQAIESKKQILQDRLDAASVLMTQ